MAETLFHGQVYSINTTYFKVELVFSSFQSWSQVRGRHRGGWTHNPWRRTSEQTGSGRPDAVVWGLCVWLGTESQGHGRGFPQVCRRQPLPCLQQLWRSPPLLNTRECISPTTLTWRTDTSAAINKAHQHLHFLCFTVVWRHGWNKYKYNMNKDRVWVWKPPWLIDKCCGHITCHADFPFQRGKLNNLMRSTIKFAVNGSREEARSSHHVAQRGETQRVESCSSNEARRRGKRSTNVPNIIKMQSENK